MIIWSNFHELIWNYTGPPELAIFAIHDTAMTMGEEGGDVHATGEEEPPIPGQNSDAGNLPSLGHCLLQYSEKSLVSQTKMKRG